jgi:hypothetical protein
MICRRRSGPLRNDFGFFSLPFARPLGFVILLSAVNGNNQPTGQTYLTMPRQPLRTASVTLTSDTRRNGRRAVSARSGRQRQKPSRIPRADRPGTIGGSHRYRLLFIYTFEQMLSRTAGRRWDSVGATGHSADVRTTSFSSARGISP